MISSKIFDPAKYFLVICLMFVSSTPSYAQYNWEWRDPLDLGAIDYGDNKMLLYNLIGIGLAHFISKEEGKLFSGNSISSFQVNAYREYRDQEKPSVIDIKYSRKWQYRKRVRVGYEHAILGIIDQHVLLGYGLSPVFNWKIVSIKNVSLTLDSAVGPVLFSSTFPDGGTRFNFYTRYGILFEYTTKNIDLGLGLLNTHFSNASISGYMRNPGFDGVGITLSFQSYPFMNE